MQLTLPIWQSRALGSRSVARRGLPREERTVVVGYWHLSVALCRGNCWVLRKGLHELTKATGRQFQRGLLHPTADLVA